MSIAALILFTVFVAYTLVRAEFEKYELKREIAQLRAENKTLAIAAAKRHVVLEPAPQSDGTPSGVQPGKINTRRRPTFLGFGRDKRRLENEEAPQRSVTV